MKLDAISRHDPAFDKTRFLSRAEAVLALVHRARAEGRPEQARAVVSEDMALRLKTELDGMRTAGRRHVHEGVRVRSADIVEATSDDRWDTVAVRFSLEGASYEAGPDGKPVAGHTRDRRRWDEVWWFQRSSAARTTAADDAPLDRCPGCGAPLAPTSEGACAYCQRSLSDPTTWSLTRISDTAAVPHPGYSAITFDAAPVARAARTVGTVITIAILVMVAGGIVAGIVLTKRAADEVTTAFDTPEDTGPGITLPGGITIPGRANPGATASTGFVTPVTNPRVRAPVNDVVAATAAVKAKVGRPLIANSIHLYPDGRIIFELQAADDPEGIDNWVWKGGEVTGPEQGLIGADLDRLYPVEGLDLSNLARLCDAALGAVNIADGAIESPYLLKIGTGLRWYIPVQSESRRSNNKTYQVSPDGSKPTVF